MGLFGNNKFEIWSEGFSATGQYSKAQFYGVVEADTFKTACDLKFQGEDTYSPEDLTLWGCQLFDNENDARKSFG